MTDILSPIKEVRDRVRAQCLGGPNCADGRDPVKCSFCDLADELAAALVKAEAAQRDAVNLAVGAAYRDAAAQIEATLLANSGIVRHWEIYRDAIIARTPADALAALESEKARAVAAFADSIREYLEEIIHE